MNKQRLHFASPLSECVPLQRHADTLSSVFFRESWTHSNMHAAGVMTKTDTMHTCWTSTRGTVTPHQRHKRG